MSRPPCRFINLPGGCRRGKDCHFAHAFTQNNANTRPLSPSSASSDRSSHPNTQRPNASGPPLPKGVCRFFWEHGRCNREFECRYEHTPKTERSSRAGPSSSRSTITPSEAVIQRLAPFLTEEGLSKMNRSGTDGFFSQDPSASLSPSEAHNALKKFLQDNFRFRTTFEVYAFLKPLSSANASNTHWVRYEVVIVTTLLKTLDRLRKMAKCVACSFDVTRCQLMLHQLLLNTMSSVRDY
jgi:hypothetical protein